MQTTDIISNFFITGYYTALHSNYKSMLKFYATDCVMSITVDNKVFVTCVLPNFRSLLRWLLERIE